MATITVDTTADELDGSITDGDVSLRDAIAAANAAGGADIVRFDAGVFNGEATDTLRLTQGELVITDAITIAGEATGVTITGDANGDDVTLAGGITDVEASVNGGLLDDNSRIFNVTDASASTTLDGLTLTGGRVAASFPDVAAGGAVRSAADLTLVGMVVDGNAADGDTALGGGIYGLGGVNVIDSTIKRNLAGGQAGAPYTSVANGGGVWAGGALALTNSAVSENTAFGSDSAYGGGVYARGSIALVGSIVSTNTADSDNDETRGGGIFGLEDVTLMDSTVRDNRGFGELDGFGGGIFADNVQLTASTVSGNFAGAAEGDAEGGGLWANTATLINSTVSNNTASDFYGAAGGGIYAGTATLSNSTVSGNIARTPPDYTAPGLGGGIVAGSVELANSIVLGNFDHIGGAPSEIEGTIVETGPNIIGGVDPADVFADIDPATGGGLLAENGGPTRTIAIRPGGPAAGGADPATATATDQRGVPRDADPDLGAFEAEQTAPAPFRIEAETLARAKGFRLENLGAASGDRVIKSPNPSVEARASLTFSGQDGVYDLDLGHFDENDGRSRLAILVDGVEIDSFVFRQNLGSSTAGTATRAVRHIPDVALETGDVITLVGRSNRDEPLRIDFIDFTFVDDLIT